VWSNTMLARLWWYVLSAVKGMLISVFQHPWKCLTWNHLTWTKCKYYFYLHILWHLFEDVQWKNSRSDKKIGIAIMTMHDLWQHGQNSE
jgi:hypothetical protein